MQIHIYMDTDDDKTIQREVVAVEGFRLCSRLRWTTRNAGAGNGPRYACMCPKLGHPNFVAISSTYHSRSMNPIQIAWKNILEN